MRDLIPPKSLVSKMSLCLSNWLVIATVIGLLPARAQPPGKQTAGLPESALAPGVACLSSCVASERQSTIPPPTLGQKQFFREEIGNAKKISPQELGIYYLAGLYCFQTEKLGAGQRCAVVSAGAVGDSALGLPLASADDK